MTAARALLLAVTMAVAVTGCGGGQSASRARRARGVVAQRWARAAAHGELVRIYYEQSPFFTPVRARVQEEADTVTVTLMVRVPTGPIPASLAIQCIHVPLGSPVGSRRVLDGARNIPDA